MADNGTAIVVIGGAAQYTKQTGGSLDVAADQIDVTNKDSTNGAKQFISGEYGGTVTMEGLVQLAEANNGESLIAVMIARTVVVLKWGKTGSGDKFYTASANVASVSLTNPKNEAAGYTAEFQLTGEITEGIVT